MTSAPVIPAVIAVVVGLATTQIVCLMLCRSLGLRLSRSAMLVSLTLASAPVVGVLAAGFILVPTDPIARMVPGMPPITKPDPHRTLNDATLQFIPWEIEVRRALRSGRLPLWSDRLDGGSSPWVNPQAGPLSPVYLLARLAPIRHHLMAAVALKILIAFQGAWLLARLLGARRPFALFAGVGYAFGGGIMAWSLFPHTSAAAWVPWLAAASIRTCRRSTPGSIAGTSTITAFLLLSGHPETALGGGIVAAVCSTFYGRRSQGLRGTVRGALACAGAATIGFAIAAPHLLPFAVHLPSTVRYDRMTNESDHDLASRSTIVTKRRVRLLRGAVSPYASGGLPYTSRQYRPRAGVAYAGLALLAGAFAATAAGQRRSWPLIAVVVVTALLIVDFQPLTAVAKGVPLLRSVSWTRLLTLVSLGLSVLGAVGLSALARRVRCRPVLAALCGAALSLWVAPSAVAALLWMGVFASITAIPRMPRFGTALLALIVTLDLGPWAIAMIPRGDPQAFFPETPFVSDLRSAVGDGSGCRVIATSRDFYPSLLAAYGFEDIRYNNPVARRDYAQVLGGALGFHPDDRPFEYHSPVRTLHPIVHFLNVGVVLSKISDLGRGFQTIAVDGESGKNIYRNRKALPKAFMPTGWTVVDDSQTLEAVLAVKKPRSVVLSRTDFDRAGILPASPPMRPPWKVEWDSDGLGRATARVGGRGPRLLATSLTHPDGWTALGDGNPLTTITVNHAFLGVVVPPDVREVELAYAPPGLRLGFALGFVGLLMTGILCSRSG